MTPTLTHRPIRWPPSSTRLIGLNTPGVSVKPSSFPGETKYHLYSLIAHLILGGEIFGGILGVDGFLRWIPICGTHFSMLINVLEGL